jgi:hypothetical protein
VSASLWIGGMSPIAARSWVTRTRGAP